MTMTITIRRLLLCDVRYTVRRSAPRRVHRSNLPIFASSMAFEVHARFWMQPNLLVCVAAGVGASAALSVCHAALAACFGLATSSRTVQAGAVGGKDARPPRPRSRRLDDAVAVVVVAAIAAAACRRAAALWPEQDFSGEAGLVMLRHAETILDALPPASLFLSHTDLSWNTVRYLTACERAPSATDGVTHISLQLVPYAWFHRQKALYPNVRFAERFAGISTDVQSSGYVAFLTEMIELNLDVFDRAGGLYLDIHGVYEPQIQDEGNWLGRFTLIPHGPIYRVARHEPPPGAGSKWLGVATAELDRMRQAWARERGPDASSSAASRPRATKPTSSNDQWRFTHRAGTWEFAVSCAYYDSIYQTGLFALTHGTSLAASLNAEVLPSYIGALRIAVPLTSLAARAATQNGTISSSVDDAEKNALVALVQLHRALSVGVQFADRAPFEGTAERRKPMPAELESVTATTADAARKFLVHRSADASAPAFSEWLKTNAP